MITVIKRKLYEKTYSRVGLDAVVTSIREGLYECEKMLPDLCFATGHVKYNGKIVIKDYNGLCLLRIRNLPGESEVREAMRLAMVVPYTALAFRGEDGRSLNVVCRYAWGTNDVAESLNEDTMQCYLSNAYKQLHYAYAVQLHQSIDTEEPSLQQTCRWATDEQAYYNPSSMPFFVQADAVEMPVYDRPRQGGVGLETSMAFTSDYEALTERYHWAYHRALDDARSQVSSPEEHVEKVLNLLAEYCHIDGLEMEVAVRMTLWKAEYWNREDHVRRVFANSYDKELSRTIPYGYVEKSALLMMRVEAYLRSRYQLRRNVLTGVVEYRHRGGYSYSFRPLTDQDINSMTTGALKMGLGSWDKDLRRILDSRDIREYDPLDDYLYNLPKWDGRDHVGQLAARIPSDTPHYAYYLRIWLRSMVAHWMGKDRLHGNALVPLLIGGQGCGKTTLCSMLLPRSLSLYYNDKVDFRSEADIMAALSNFALINIDEFDSLKKSQQPVLKYLLSKGGVKYRPPYGRAIVERRRYASFIATTNLRHPLQDTTGSRRFACIQIRDGEQIDFHTPLDHAQLYAQLKHEIDDGERYWLDDEETAVLQSRNASFQQLADLGTLLDNAFVHPDEADATDNHSPHWHSVDEVIVMLRQAYPDISPTTSFRIQVGKLLSEKRYLYRKSKRCALYFIAPR